MYDGNEKRSTSRENHICLKEESINKLYDFHNEKMKQLQEMEKRQIIIASDVTVIKQRIENGLSHSVEDMHMNLTKLIPVIDGHTRFIERFQDVLICSLKTFVIGIGVAILGLFVWAIALGWKP